MLRRFAVVATLAVALTVPAFASAATAKKPGGAAATRKGAAEPLDVTREFYKALHAGNARAAAKLATSKDAEPALQSFVQVSRAYRDLEAALAKRFGADAADLVGYGRKVQSEIKALLGATVEVEGASARVVGAVDGHLITTLRRVGGAWRVELEDGLDTPQGRADFAAQARASRAAAAYVVPRIGAGEYETPSAAISDFEERIAGAAAEWKGSRPEEREGAPGEQEGSPAIPEEGGAQL